MDFGLRLKNLRLDRGLTQQSFADKIGVSTITVRNWERGKKKPNMDAIISIAEALRISADMLLDITSSKAQPQKPVILSPGEKSLLKLYRELDDHGKKAVDTICLLESERVDASRNKSASNIIEFKRKSVSERFIPRYTSPAAAGTSIPLDGADFEMMLVDDSVPYQADYAVNIQGNSMYPYIKDGDMVYVQKDADIKIGDIGIWCVDGAMYCKQYYLDEEKNLLLVSANKDLQNTNVFVPAESGSSVKFCGKVLLAERVDLPDYLFEED